jgi:hypothetical protein
LISRRSPPRRASGIVRPIRVEPAFDDRDAVRALFAQHSPYSAAALYLPDGSSRADRGGATPPSVWPRFRGTWAIDGRPLVAGVEPILRNERFIAAAGEAFSGATIVPKTVVVNVNPPMPAGVPHVDVPSFRGATRATVPLRLLLAMGASGLFETWRIAEAGAISWFYDGVGGGYDYWPDGLDGAKRTEKPPFGNVAIVADNDRMFHRIERIGPPDAALPSMTAGAIIRRLHDTSWAIFEGDELRARYPAEQVRLSVLWKAEVVLPGRSSDDALDEDRIATIFRDDLHARGIEAAESSSLFTDAAWIALLEETYGDGDIASRAREA